jgi:hypothetical protein
VASLACAGVAGVRSLVPWSRRTKQLA